MTAKRLALPEHAKAIDFSKFNPSQCCVIAPSDLYNRTVCACCQIQRR
jgi:hypothetical protein